MNLQKITIGIIGAGTMGSGIAQVAATAGHVVIIIDSNDQKLVAAKEQFIKILARLVEKNKLAIGENVAIAARVVWTTNINELKSCQLVLEAVVENLAIKQQVFKNLEMIVAPDCILATNTSSLSVASIAAACAHSERVVGLHFFNPAPLMQLVEVVSAVQTASDVTNRAEMLVKSWGKRAVRAKDTPGFIVNRIARPFYGEALRIFEENIADIATIDWAMRSIGGFRMGPFELMDYIGNDVNYAVTETVFTAFFYDSRYKPSFTQKRLVEAGRLGKKTNIGFYDYRPNAPILNPLTDEELGNKIVSRIVVMLINEAADAIFWQIGNKEDVDIAMMLGVNYPKGLLKWADEIGIENILLDLESLQTEYGEERYRPSPLLKKMLRMNMCFF